jgi:hypothetical protein
MAVTPASTICSGSCTWQFQAGGWIVTASSCTGGCGCSAPGSFPRGGTLPGLPPGRPALPVPHDDFVDAVNSMIADSRVPAHFKTSLALTPLPAIGTNYDMPCVS